jgi:hypothetical protein
MCVHILIALTCLHTWVHASHTYTLMHTNELKCETSPATASDTLSWICDTDRYRSRNQTLSAAEFYAGLEIADCV